MTPASGRSGPHRIRRAERRSAGALSPGAADRRLGTRLTGGSAGNTGRMDVLVLADTHIRRGSSRTLPPRVRELADGADHILHAGDVVVGEVLDDLRGHAPVDAVLGNNDHELVGVLPATRTFDLAGVRVAMVHDSGPARGRARRLHRCFPSADVVVFGHSHIPWNELGEDGQVLFNPGSPTERRRHPHHTAGLLTLHRGAVTRRKVIVVDR